MFLIFPELFAMDDSINVDNVNLIKEKENLSDKQDDVIDETLASTEKAQSIENNTLKWSIVHFDTDIEENIESFNDLIPSSWITKRERLCFYPMNIEQRYIN